ncbi:MAG TPA: acyltransferase [Cyclobacteriaceae bacterium]|nr:acyltransferase [Cyclobacteriaceae bacterium]
MRFKIFVAGFANFLWNDLVTHFPVRFVRKGFLRLFNSRISRSAVILMHTRILNFWNVDIGDRAVINQHVLLDCRKYKVRIDHDADIGPYTRVWTLGHSPESATHETVGGDVVISHHVWIASNVTILPAVSIGAGAVIGSASLVSKNIPSGEVWAGNPARFIRKRVNDLKYVLKYDPYFE